MGDRWRVKVLLNIIRRYFASLFVCFCLIYLAEIEESEMEVMEDQELSKSLLGEPKSTFVQAALSEYNRKTVGDNSTTANCTPGAHISFIDRHYTNDFEIAQPENIDLSDDEGAQTPLESDIRAQEVNEGMEGKENIIPTPQAKFVKTINFSAVPRKNNDQQKAIAKSAISGAINISRSSVHLLRDFKEGWLEKKSRSLLKPWKAKYCRISNFQFFFYKNVTTGWLSGFIDFRRVVTKITVDNSSLCFK